ncbi:MAG: hypothetical protein ACHP7J_06075 [Terriglobales bacterium]
MAAAAGITVVLGSEAYASVLVPCALAGVVVSAATAVTVRRLTKNVASMVGFLIGLAPSTAGIVWGCFFAEKRVDAAVGWLALSLWLSVPSSVGGALCGFVSSQAQQVAP